MGATAGGAIRGRRANPLLPLLVAFLLTGIAHAVVLTLRPGRAECITEGLRGPAVSVASYRVTGVGGNGLDTQKHKIRVRVRDPKGKSIRRVESVESGEFAFLAKRTGRYSACFWTPRSNSSASISIDLEWRSGNATQKWHSVARESKIEMQAQMQEAQASKQPLQGPNPSATVGAKAYASTGDMAAAAAASDAEGEEDDEDDNEDGGKGEND